ncbi:MAG: hypothetical protein GY835_16175, partial [bacterium]|nr:hypothetical protein [bacterium]
EILKGAGFNFVIGESGALAAKAFKKLRRTLDFSDLGDAAARGIREGAEELAPSVSRVARNNAEVPRGTTGFAPGEGVSALTANRLQHGTRHLSEAGVLQPWRGSTSPQLIRDTLGPVLERPIATFDHVLRGGAPVRGFLGDVNGQQVVLFVYKQGPYQGQLATSVVPSASQLSKWGIP